MKKKKKKEEEEDRRGTRRTQLSPEDLISGARREWTAMARIDGN